MTTTLSELVDLDRYPINRLQTDEGVRFIAECRAIFEESGVLRLPNFLVMDAVKRTLDELPVLMDQLWCSDREHNVYFTELIPADPSLSFDARSVSQRTSQNSLAYDLMPASLPLRQLYERDELVSFVAAVLGVSVLYRSGDALDACEIAVFRPGQQLGWHFDNSEFAVTLMLQPSREGGCFDYVRGLRHPSDATNGIEAVGRFLAGESDYQTTRLEPTAGMFTLFQGRYALHRVTPVEGETSRFNAVMNFSTEPNTTISEATRLMFYGRLA